MAIPTLIMIPSGYKAQKVYSVLPINGDGDFTFDRTTTATRVNKNGLIEQVATDVPRLDYPINYNLVLYSEDFTNTFWATGGSIRTSGFLSPSGELNACLVKGGGYNHMASYGMSLPSLRTYTLSVYLKASTPTTVILKLQELGGNYTNYSFSEITLTNEWVRYEVTGQKAQDGNLARIVIDGIADEEEFFIWGAQLEEQPYATPYIPTPHGGCPSLLLEPYSLNLVSYSEDFSQGWSRYNSEVTTNQTTSPRGDLTADILQSTDTYQPMVQRYFNPPTTNTTYTFSVFVKKINTPYVALGVYNGSSDKNAIFDLDTKLSRSSVENSSIKEFSNGWFRISITQTILSTDTNNTWKILNSNGSSALTGVVGDETFIWGAQLEELPYLSSYIPTLTNSSVGSRGEETFSNNFSSQPTVENTNTVVLKFIPMGFKQDFYELLRFSDGTNQIALEGFQTNNYDVYGNGLSPSGMIDGALSLDAGSINIISFSYSGTSLRFSHNGSTINTTTPTGNLPTITQVLNGAGGLSPIKILDLRVYNDFKTQEELNRLTTITI